MDGDARGDCDQQRWRGDEGLKAYWRWKGREFTEPVVQFGECVMYLTAASAGKNKFDVRRMDGVRLGTGDHTLESGESIIGAACGLMKARDFRRIQRKKDLDQRQD